MRRLLVALELWLALATAYLLALLGLAARRRPPTADPGGRPLTTVVLVPAHNEAAGLPATVRDLLAQGLRAEVIVIADNCSDATAAVGRAAGATVWERVHDERGKGQALAWALERLWRERPATEAVAIVDADCSAPPHLLTELERRLRSGAAAAQAVYDVANPGASPTAALRWGAFALKHRVRPRGRTALGLSAGLFGTGMAFRAELLRAHPWRSFSNAEDAEYHLQLARAGVRVAYVAGTCVESAMPTTAAAAHDQQLRWESGNAALARRHALPLALSAVRRRDANLAATAFELIVPPQTLLVPATLACLAAGAIARSRPLTRAAAATAAGQALYVVGGLRVAGAPPAVYRALASAPRLAAHKLAVFARIASGHGTDVWLPTQREPATDEPVEVG